MPKNRPTVEAVIMAGGRGERLRPFTDSLPKPLLPVGEMPILVHVLTRLALFNIKKVHLAIYYRGDEIRAYCGNGKSLGMNISYIEESEPLGTIGALRLAEGIRSEYVLVMNSDLLTNINFADFAEHCFSQHADMCIATTPYDVKVPYAIVETEGNRVVSFREKPTYTYFAHAGIYLFKREFVAWIPKKEPFNATDLIEMMLRREKHVVQFPILGYWLDIGQPDEYRKAQEDIKYIDFSIENDGSDRIPQKNTADNAAVQGMA